MLVIGLGGWTLLLSSHILTSLWFDERLRKNVGHLFLWSSAGFTALFTATSPFWATLAPQYADVTWNVDYRFHLLHVRTILSADGMSDSLAISGQDVVYHTGPSWGVAALYSILSVPISASSFLLIPALSVISLAIGLSRLLETLGFRSRNARTGSLAALVIPTVGTSWPGGIANPLRGEPPLDTLSDLITSYSLWFLGPNLMLNSYFALGLIGAAFSMLTSLRTPHRSILLFIVAVSLHYLKPQYSIAFLAVALVWVFTETRRARSTPLHASLMVSFVLSSLVVLLLSLEYGSQSFILSSASKPSFFFYAWQISWPFFGTVALAALIAFFGRSSTTYSRLHLSARQSTIMLALIALCHAAAIVAGTWYFWPAIDLETSTSGLVQGLRFTSLVLSAALVAYSSQWLKKPIRVALGAGAVLSMLILTSQAAFSIVVPSMGYEAWDNREIRRLLQDIPTEETLLLTSDMAEPSENYRRFANAHYLSIPFGHQFYLADIDYEARQHPKIVRERLESLRLFFETPFGEWHRSFLRNEQITHVFVSDRCPPVWWESISGDNQILPAIVSTKELETVEFGATSPSPTTDQANIQIVQKYGIAPCLGPRE